MTRWKHSVVGFVALHFLLGCSTVPEEIAKEFNEFFVFIVKNLDNKHANRNEAIELPTKANRVEYIEMKPIPFTESELRHTISSM